MKTIRSSKPRRGRLERLALMAILAVLFCAQIACAEPRAPWPPFPEKQPLCQKTFDEGFFVGETNSELLIAGLGTLHESFSGYALERVGPVIPFVVPALDSTGNTNGSCGVGGSFRFWITPYWTSTSVANGSGPCAKATVLELDAVSGGQSALAWSLQVSADGNTLGLFAETGSGLQEILQTPIAWMAGQPHCLALVEDSECTTLYVDGSMAAQGPGLPSIPLSAGQLVIGSTLAGGNAAGADIDEFYSFDSLLSPANVAMYYEWYSGLAGLGPYYPPPPRLQRNLATSATLGPVYDPDQDGGCPTGGQPYLTNMIVSLDASSNIGVSLDVRGGTNGFFYDLYTTTNLSSAPFPSGWNWLCQVETCNSCLFSAQPSNAAFYAVTPPLNTMFVAVGSDTGGQTDVPAGLTNAMGVAGGGNFTVVLLDNGTVRAWGDNTYGQTNPPAGLSNVAALAAGQFHAVALLANGAVTNWGCYWDGEHYVSVTNTVRCALPPTSNVVAVAAGIEHDMALLTSGTVVTWGMTNALVNYVPTNITGVQAIGCGWANNVVLLTNGRVMAWGCDVFHQDDVPPGLSNVVAIATAPQHSLALLADGTVQAWGDGFCGDTTVPAGLSNVVAIAAGGSQSLALQAVGTVVAWGAATVPIGMTATKNIACGFGDVLAIRSGQLDPVITQEPSDTFSLAGQTNGFSVTVAPTSGLQYQWQFGGVNITNATNSTFAVTNSQSTNVGDYDVVVSSYYGVVTSVVARLDLVLAPEISSTTPVAPGPMWINYPANLLVGATAIGEFQYPLSFSWQINGTNIYGASSDSYTISSFIPANDGKYTVTVTNIVGTNSVSWIERLALPGMVEAWGSDTNGECDRPATLTNVAAIAAGDYHSVAATDGGTVLQWGKYSDGTNFYPVGSPPVLTNVVAVAASRGHDLALNADGTVTNWGITNDIANFVPPNLSNITAIVAGWYHNLALSNGAVVAWGDNTYGQTTVPADLTNVIAIAAGQFHSLALRADGKVEAWGCDSNGQTDVPSSALSNIVAIAAGGQHSLALQSSGSVVAWGHGQTNVPTAAMSNVMVIAAGSAHSVALKNDGSLVAWGDDSSGQTNIPAEQPTTVITTTTVTTTNGPLPSFQTNTYPPIVFKLIAAGGNHSLAAIWSPLVQYPVDVSKDLLLIYNANSLDSSNVCQYYRTHRPMVSNANVLGIGCTTNDPILPSDFNTYFQPQVQMWLSNNPTLRPQYVILFQNVPQEVDPNTNIEDTAYPTDGQPSVQYQLHASTAPGWYPFVTAINMNGLSGTNFNSSDGTNDCIAYVDKLISMASNNPPGTLIISATAAGYGNTNWYFDDGWGIGVFSVSALEGVTNVDPTASVFINHSGLILAATNLAGYLTSGWDGGHSSGYATNTLVNGGVQFSGSSGWYIMTSVDSFCGHRYTFQSSYLTWFASNSFGGTNYSNTPVGATTTVDEPGSPGTNPEIYYQEWVAGKSFAISAWAGMHSKYEQAVGDPFTRK